MTKSKFDMIEVLPNGKKSLVGKPPGIYLVPDNWNDYSYRTLFTLYVIFSDRTVDIGNVKIGFKGQTTKTDTDEYIDKVFHMLDDKYFSLGCDADYYSNLLSIDEPERLYILKSLRDIVYLPEANAIAKSENVFRSSLMRAVSNVEIEQFGRIIDNKVILTNFDFHYISKHSNNYPGITLSFAVKPQSKPPSNIHAIIGRNGSGKTTFLNDMIMSYISNNSDEKHGKFCASSNPNDTIFVNYYLSRMVSISFSSFDSFYVKEVDGLNSNQIDYKYIGIKKDKLIDGESRYLHKDLKEFSIEFSDSLYNCLEYNATKKRWIEAINQLEIDPNFKKYNLLRLIDVRHKNKRELFQRVFGKLSSGHAIVLLAITKLVEHVREKTLVVVDEPESHLHPPLLSSFMKALSRLLIERNAISIMATHSPVVLQEIPKDCVYIINRDSNIKPASRPDIETFGENIGILTKEVFKLELEESSYYYDLLTLVNEGKNYDEVIKLYDNKIGFEGQILLKALTKRESQ